MQNTKIGAAKTAKSYRTDLLAAVAHHLPLDAYLLLQTSKNSSVENSTF